MVKEFRSRDPLPLKAKGKGHGIALVEDIYRKLIRIQIYRQESNENITQSVLRDPPVRIESSGGLIRARYL